MSRTRRGFTLIELLAVAAMLAMVAAIVLPRIGIGGERRTLAEGERLAASLEATRQRAAVSGTPHRLLLDLDLQAYRVEAWQPEDDPAVAAGEPLPHPAHRDWADVSRLPLTPPRPDRRRWEPLPGPLGQATRLPEAISVTAVERGADVVDRGRLFLAFGADGSGEGARIELTDTQGNRVTLEVAPLADAVRLAWGGLRETRGG